MTRRRLPTAVRSLPSRDAGPAAGQPAPSPQARSRAGGATPDTTPQPPPFPASLRPLSVGFSRRGAEEGGARDVTRGGGGGGTGRSEGDKIGGTGARGGGSGALWQHEPFPPPPPPLPPPSARGRSQRPVSPAPPPPRPGGRLPAALPCSAPPGARCPDVGPFRGRVLPAAATTAAAATAAAPPRRVPRRRGCSMEADGEAEARLLLQEARESIEAARSYRRELEQRLRGLHQARKQVRGKRDGVARAVRGGGGARSCFSPPKPCFCVETTSGGCGRQPVRAWLGEVRGREGESRRTGGGRGLR